MADDNSNLNKSGDRKDEKKDTLPPTLKDFQKTRIKLQGSGPRTLLERMKSFRKKDLLFILSGLGILVAAPLAEHLMMGQQPNGLTQGFGIRNGLPGGFGGGGSPFEPGINGLAPGQAAGGNGDIITPFNARDPASLILSPDAAAQPPVGSSNAPADNGNGQDNGQAPWKNVLAQAGGNAAGAATQSAGLPVAPPALGDGIFADHGPANSTSASYTPPPISASNVPNRAAGNDSLGQVRGGGVTGASPYSMTGQGNSEGLKSAADQAGAYFNRPTSAAGGLEKAASVNMPSGGSGSSGAGAGGSQADKGFGQDSNKGSKSAGESLAEKAAEQNQQHAIELYWKKLEEQQMWPIKEQEKIKDALLMAPINAFAKKIGDEMSNIWPGPHDSDVYACPGQYQEAGGGGNPVSINGNIGACGSAGETSGGYCYDTTDTCAMTSKDYDASQSDSKNPPGASCLLPVGTNKCVAVSGGNTGSTTPPNVLGPGSGAAVSTIGNAGGAVDTDANALKNNLASICDWAATNESNCSQQGSDGNSGKIANPHSASLSCTALKSIYDGQKHTGSANDIAQRVYSLSATVIDKCGVSGLGPNAVSEISAANADMKSVITDVKQVSLDETNVLNTVADGLCGNPDAKPCPLQTVSNDAKGGSLTVAQEIENYWQPRHDWQKNNKSALNGQLSSAYSNIDDAIGHSPDAVGGKIADANQHLTDPTNGAEGIIDANKNLPSGDNLVTAFNNLPPGEVVKLSQAVNKISPDYETLVTDSRKLLQTYQTQYNNDRAAAQSGGKLVGDVNKLLNSTPLGQTGDISLPVTTVQLPSGDGPGFILLMNQEAGKQGYLSQLSSQDPASMQAEKEKAPKAIQAIGASGAKVLQNAGKATTDASNLQTAIGTATKAQEPTPSPSSGATLETTFNRSSN